MNPYSMTHRLICNGQGRSIWFARLQESLEASNSCESCKAAGAPPQTPMGALAPPYLLVWGWGGGGGGEGGGVPFAHPHKTLERIVVTINASV